MHSPTHNLRHKGSEILLHSSTPYTNARIFGAEHNLKQNVKSLSGISNGRDQFRIVAQFHRYFDLNSREILDTGTAEGSN